MKAQLTTKKSMSYAAFVHVIVLVVLLVSLSFNSPMQMQQALPYEQSDKIMNAVSVNQTDVEQEVQKIQKKAELDKKSEQQKLLAMKKKALQVEQQRKNQEAQLAKLKQEKLALAKQAKEQIEALNQEKLKAKKELAETQAQAAKEAKLQKLKLEKEHLKKTAISDLQNEIAQEQTQLNAQQKVAVTNEISKYTALMLQAMSKNWIYPPDVNKELHCILEIKLAAGGIVKEVILKRTSGDSRLDQSAISAVYKASPLPVPENPDIFRQMQDINLKVSPKNTLDT